LSALQRKSHHFALKNPPSLKSQFQKFNFHPLLLLFFELQLCPLQRLILEFFRVCQIFPEFRNKGFSLLWRGFQDGFSAFEFHRQCDHHLNTLTVILDTDGNVFGGFVAIGWESRRPNSILDASNYWKEDESVKSFLFSLKNPEGRPAKRFPLK
jgi:hypothetical protein